MPCSKEVTISGTAPLPVYWGLTNTDTLNSFGLFGPDVMPLWADADFDTLISILPFTETAPYRNGTGYYMGSDAPFSKLEYFWFVVPDSYPDFLPTTGLQFGYENAVVPFKSIIPWNVVPATINDGGASNWPSTDIGFGGGFLQDSGGWWYFPHTLSGIPYRFYAFAEKMNTVAPGPVCNPVATFSIGVGYSRTSNVATFTINPGVDWTAFTGASDYAITVQDCSDSSFNIPQPGVSWSLDTIFDRWDYPNPGPDVGFSADSGFTVYVWTRLQNVWQVNQAISDDYGLPAYSFTLFVST